MNWVPWSRAKLSERRRFLERRPELRASVLAAQGMNWAIKVDYIAVWQP
jgi:hypothetical protein